MLVVNWLLARKVESTGFKDITLLDNTYITIQYIYIFIGI